jgi:hypothetical protein
MKPATCLGPAAHPGRTGAPTRVWRFIWLIIALVTVVLFTAEVLAYYRQLQTPCLAAPCYASPTPDQVRAIEAAGVTLAFAARYQVTLIVFCAAVHVAVAAVIFWRGPADRMAWFTSLALLTFGTFGLQDDTTVHAVLAAYHPLWRVPVDILKMTSAVSMSAFYFIFPNGRFVPRWLRWPAVVLFAQQALVVVFPLPFLDPTRWPILANVAYWGLVFGVFVYVQLYRYRYVSTAAQRQQTKWVVFGIILALSGALGGYVLTVVGPLLNPRLAPLTLAQGTSYYPFLALVPLSIGVAILRSRLWDIDVLIRRTLVYSALTAVLAMAYFGSVLLLESSFRALTGQGQNSLVAVLSTLGIAALSVPLRRHVQAVIDRRFYRSQYNAARTLAQFAADARDETDLQKLSERLALVVEETFRPTHTGLWLRPTPAPSRNSEHAPLNMAGKGEPP